MVKVIKIGSREFLTMGTALVPIDQIIDINFHSVGGEGIKTGTITSNGGAGNVTLTLFSAQASELHKFLKDI